MPVITVNGVPLNYRTVGNSNRPPLVLAHTVLWGAEVFAPVIARLAQHFYILDVDLHGHGRSGYRDPLCIVDMADDYHQLLAELGFSRVSWLGYSLGSMVGMRLAIRRPDLIDKLVLMATNARSDHSPLAVQTRQLWQLFRAGHREDVVMPALPLFFSRATMQNQPQLVEQYCRKAISLQEVEGIYQAAMAASNRSDVMDQLGAIKAETLVIAGSEDETATPAEAQEIAARTPNAQLAIVADTSHRLLVEKPQEVVRIIADFLI
jgi:pimeloyl-ACP methyl ester carboxylesterase